MRAILIGPRLDDIESVKATLNDPDELANRLAPALPQAIARRGHDPQLSKALAPSIEHALTVSVRQNPHPLADALFPVMGPAIRSAIAHALSGMLDSFNRTIEHSVSWRAIGWRIEALRTGRSFGEIVLLNTLEYRVEQVFLIHRETGLLLQHVAAPSANAHDADMISSMLTAIRDFVRDSFGAAKEDALDALRVGPLLVLVEQGPDAILAAVARGTPPASLRSILQDAVETIHLQFATDLSAFTGDSAPFVAARPILESCLQSRYHARARRGFTPARALVAAAVVLALAVWAGFAIRDGRRWVRYLDRLRAEPGVTIVSAERHWRRFAVTGLRDPLATDPTTLIAASGLAPERVSSNWQLYQALEPSFILARASRLLNPPVGVSLRMDAGTLVAAGQASDDWVRDSERLAPLVTGVQRFDNAVRRGIERDLKARIERTSINFVRGRADLTPGQEATRKELAEWLRRANAIAAAAGARVSLTVVGHADSDGDEAVNAPLSLERAQVVAHELSALALDAVDVAATGVGSSQPASTGQTEEDKHRNRRNSFALEFREASARKGLP